MTGEGVRPCVTSHIYFLVEFNSFKSNFQKFCETFELVFRQNSMKCVSPECVFTIPLASRPATTGERRPPLENISPPLVDAKIVDKKRLLSMLTDL